MSGQPEITHIAPDDPQRQLTVVDPDDPGLLHLGVVGDTYTVLVSGAQTDGRYALIDMLIPPGGGPPPHRHDFEEQFHVLDGEISVSFRGGPVTAGAGQTVNIPARAPHSFTNATDRPLRLLCMVSPAGMEEYFAAFGDVVESRTSPAPQLSQAELMARLAAAAPVAARFKIEALPPGGD
jgi:mannose-6-phosphate isomerase-like protein (cupin superfamily)